MLIGKDYDSLWQRCIDTWGREQQEIQLKEEMYELGLALHHFHRGKTSIVHVADEIADVLIMLEQLQYDYKLNSIVDSRIHCKIERLKEKLDKIP